MRIVVLDSRKFFYFLSYLICIPTPTFLPQYNINWTPVNPMRDVIGKTFTTKRSKIKLYNISASGRWHRMYNASHSFTFWSHTFLYTTPLKSYIFQKSPLVRITAFFPEIRIDYVIASGVSEVIRLHQNHLSLIHSSFHSYKHC